jgi:hypothetical protein
LAPGGGPAKPQDSRVVDGAEQGLRGQTGGDETDPLGARRVEPHC